MKQKRLTLILFFIFIFTFNFNISAATVNKKPHIYGKAAITIDINTGEIIYTKNIDKKMYPASTTKLMTALLLAENKNKDDDLKYTKTAKAQPAYSLGLNVHNINIGETMKAEDVMDSLLLYSGNDIAYMIADNVSGKTDEFINLMNKKSKALKLINTNFITPNGLHNENHYTTPYDLTIIGRTAFKNPWVKESMNKQKSTVETSKGTKMIIENRNRLLGQDGCIGGKTGYTDKAGRCLVAIYERNGRKIIGVVMNSVYDKNDSFVFNDMKKIIDWSYNQKRTPIYKKNIILKKQTISYKPLLFTGPTKTIEVPIMLKENVEIYDNSINKKELKTNVTMPNIKISKLKSNKPIGTLTINQRENSKSYKLYTSISKGNIIKQNLLLYSGVLIGILILLSLVICIIKKINKRKRRRRRTKYF